MNPVPHTIPISDLRFHQSEVLAQVAENPVILTKQGRGVAMLVDPAYWNQIIEELDDLADALAVAQSKLALANGEEALTDWATVKAELQEAPQLVSAGNGV